MPQSASSSVRLAKKALAIYAREIGEDADDTEAVMTDFLASMMKLADDAGADFAAIVESAKTQVEGGF